MTTKIRYPKLLISLLVSGLAVALLIVVSIWRQDAARDACESSKISFANLLSVPCPAVWQHGDGVLVTNELDLSGEIVSGTALAPTFTLWYFEKPHRSIGASLFERLGVTEAFLDNLNLGPQEVVARSLRDARSGDLYRLDFWRVGDEWRARTYLTENLKPTAGLRDNTSVLAVMAIKYLPQGAGVLYFVSCDEMIGSDTARIPEPRFVSGSLIERPASGCTIDLPHQHFYMQAVFSKELVGRYLRVIEASQNVTKRWAAQTN